MDLHGRIAIIGGGILGCGAAYALARAGCAHVEVIERDRLGSAATARAAGILSLHTWNDLDADLILATRRLVEELVTWGRDHDFPAARTAWHPVGGVTIAQGERLGRLETMRDRMRRMGEDSELVDAGEAARRHPRFRFAPGEWALLGAQDGYLESSDLIELVRARARGMGVRFREGVPVRGLRLDRGRVDGLVLEGGTQERTDAVVVAGGAWTPSFLAGAGVRVPAIPYRTQLATLEGDGFGSFPVLHDTVHHFYARPESGSRFLAGDGTQLRPFDPDAFNAAADLDFIEATAQRVLGRFVGGDAVRYRSGWAGLCVGTPDRRPLAGPAPGVEGLFVLTGDNGFGLMRGLALGDVVCATALGRPHPQASSTRLDRFGASPPTSFAVSEGFSFPD